jgi:hypothetical protein
LKFSFRFDRIAIAIARALPMAVGDGDCDGVQGNGNIVSVAGAISAATWEF